ncbi:acyltransferase family protein [Paenibacillus soyae]|uniref:Acyltransferase n=1 Tax=Paenibacillus soyae TaxID=2969249 RepID=A0A9X2MPN7_9BACL|nr:acyltransferase [Paenibacillus soyae]
MRKFYPGITVFKFAGALLVLFAHAMYFSYMTNETPSELASFAALASRVVVPCFYAIAGFLAYKGWTHAERPGAYVRRYMLRIGILYGCFCLLFAAQHIIPALVSGGFTVGNLVLQGKILFMVVFVSGPYVHLWFIPPLLFGIASSYWLLRKGNARVAALLILAGYSLCQFTSGSLRFVFEGGMDGFLGVRLEHWNYADLAITNHIGFGLTFVFAGALAARYEEWFLALRAGRWTIIALALAAAEVGLLLAVSEWTTEYKLIFSILPLTLLLFRGVLRIRSRFATIYHRTLSLFSVVTYISHILFMQANRFLFGWELGAMAFSEHALQFALTLAECTLLTYAIIRWTRRTADARRSAEVAHSA